MTIWNAPEPMPDHLQMACLPALCCRADGRNLSRKDPNGANFLDHRRRYHVDRANEAFDFRLLDVVAVKG